MNTRIPKIGDRYKSAFTWEVIGNIRFEDGKWFYACKILSVDSDNICGNWFTAKYDEYLGNFSKSNTFETLYDLLNS